MAFLAQQAGARHDSGAALPRRNGAATANGATGAGGAEADGGGNGDANGGGPHGGGSLLDVVPTSAQQRTPVVIGSRDDVSDYLAAIAA